MITEVIPDTGFDRIKNEGQGPVHSLFDVVW